MYESFFWLVLKPKGMLYELISVKCSSNNLNAACQCNATDVLDHSSRVQRFLTLFSKLCHKQIHIKRFYAIPSAQIV
jgi:hypothetical protein